MQPQQSLLHRLHRRRAKLQKGAALSGACKKMDKKKKEAPQCPADSHCFLPVLIGLLCLTASVACIVYRTLSNRKYYESWRDYDECGLS